MERGILLRRGAHVLVAFTPLYYQLPDELPIVRIQKWVGLVIFFASILAFEAVRLWWGLTFLGLRPHESRNIASHAWAAAGITVALWFFPQDIASVGLVGMALVDPLAGELRGRYKQQSLTIGIPVAVYFVLSSVVLLAYGFHSLPAVVIVSVIGATTAVVAERQKIPRIDDDFLMIVIPCLMMDLFMF
jgi:dolichol kinase